jgi:hypothetical protein
MGFAFATGIGGGDDPSVIDDSSAAVKCPDATSAALLQNIGTNLPSSLSGSLQVARVRSNATESLYFVAALGPNQQLAAGLLHCSEAIPSRLEVLGIATSASKGATPSP